MGTTQSNTTYQEVIVVSNYDGSEFTGLSSSNFSTSYILDGTSYSDSITDSFSEVGSTGKYIYSVEFPQEGAWLATVAIQNTTEIVEIHYINIQVKDGSGVTISSQSSGTSLGPIDTLNFLGSGVQVTRSGSTLNVDITGATQKTPSGTAGSGSVQTQIGGQLVTLSFSSTSEQ